MPNAPIGVYQRKTGQPFARPGTYAAGFNDRAVGKPYRGEKLGDYNMGWNEAATVRATAADAFNQTTVRQ